MNTKTIKNSSKKKIRLDIGEIIVFIIVAIYCLMLILVLLWGLLVSVKSEYEFIVDKNILGIPRDWKFNNFILSFERMTITNKGHSTNAIMQLVNSFIYAFGCTVFSTMSKVVVAYAVSKYKFFLRKILYSLAVITMILPIVGNMPSMLSVLRIIGLYDSIFGVFFMDAGFSGMYFLLFVASFDGISNTYKEAAEIDGAGHFSIMFRIMLPLIKTIILSIGLLTFISFWNTYEQPMMYIPSMPTIAYGLFAYSQSSWSANAPALLSGAFIVCIPMIILFIIFRNRIMVNVSMGGIKG